MKEGVLLHEMIPDRGDDNVTIPMSFDVKTKRDNLSIRKMILGLLITIAGFILMIVLFFIMEDSKFIPLLVGFGTFLSVRLFFLHELTYKKKQKDLIDHDYKYPTKTFWGIYSINEYYPFICKMSNEALCIFVAFDKDVIVGRSDDADYDHFEAITNAYATMANKGIYCVHIDYADVVGKDDRMDSLFDNLIETENKDIKNETIRLYDYVQSYMYRSYADYDVYAFFYYGSEEAFWDDLQPVLDAFSEANYVRNRILTREEIGDLCITLMNLNDFSTARATESVFLSNVRGGNSIKVIWTEKDGVRKVVNRTREEIDNERRIKAAENVVRESGRKRKKKKKKKGKADIDMNQNLDIFDD